MLRNFRWILGLALAATAWPQIMGDVPTVYFGPVQTKSGETARLAFSNLFGPRAVQIDMRLWRVTDTVFVTVAHKTAMMVPIGGFEVIEYTSKGENLFGIVRITDGTSNTALGDVIRRASLQIVTDTGVVRVGEAQGAQGVYVDEISNRPRRSYHYGPLRLKPGQTLRVSAFNPPWNGAMGLQLAVFDATTATVVGANKTPDTAPGGSQVIEFVDTTSPRDTLVVIAVVGQPRDFSAQSIQVLQDGNVVLLAAPRGTFTSGEPY